MHLLPEFPPLRTFALALVFWVVVAGIAILVLGDLLARLLRAALSALRSLFCRLLRRAPRPGAAPDDYATLARRLPPRP